MGTLRCIYETEGPVASPSDSRGSIIPEFRVRDLRHSVFDAASRPYAWGPSRQARCPTCIERRVDRAGAVARDQVCRPRVGTDR